jgi:hypothetical protein
VALRGQGRDAFSTRRRRPSGAGGLVRVHPRGVAHTWQNTGRGSAILLAAVTPAGLERFFERYGELAEEAANLDTFSELGAAVGMTVVGPPLAQSHPT